MEFQLVRGRGIASASIGWFGGGGFSHADVITPAGMLRGAREDIYEYRKDGKTIEIPPGYLDRPAHYLDGKIHGGIIFSLDVTPEQEAAYWKFSDAQLGKPYDDRSIWGFAFGRRDWRRDDSWFCSEEIVANGEIAGFIPPMYEDANRVDPGDLAFILCALGAKQKPFYCF